MADLEAVDLEEALAVAEAALAEAALAEVPVAVDSAAVITAPAVSTEDLAALIIAARVFDTVIITARVSLVGGDLATTDTVVEDALAVLWARCWHLLSFCSLLAL